MWRSTISGANGTASHRGRNAFIPSPPSPDLSRPSWKAVPTVSGTTNSPSSRRNRSPITLSRPLVPSWRDSRTLLTLKSRDFRSPSLSLSIASTDEPAEIRKHLHSRQLFSIKVLVNHKGILVFYYILPWMSLGMCTKLALVLMRPMINFYLISLYENVQYDQFFIDLKYRIKYRIKIYKWSKENLIGIKNINIYKYYIKYIFNINILLKLSIYIKE